MGDTITESNRLSTRLLPVYEHSITPLHQIVKTFTVKKKMQNLWAPISSLQEREGTGHQFCKKVSTRQTLHAGVNTQRGANG